MANSKKVSVRLLSSLFAGLVLAAVFLLSACAGGDSEDVGKAERKAGAENAGGAEAVSRAETKDDAVDFFSTKSEAAA